MPGMHTGLSSDNPTIVSAFHRELLHEGLVVLAILAVVLVAWNVLRARQLREVNATDGSTHLPTSLYTDAEPAARKLLRVSFGIIWIFDGILQAQSSMPLGMAPQVIRPAAASSPSWVQHLDNTMATIWSYHPISAPSAAVWIQIGIGAWLLAAPRGNWSRLGGMASVVWGLVVWVFGEAFGQIFAPGLTWLFGAPGAVLFYCAAGALVALPERAWAGLRLGRAVLWMMGAFFIGMAVLQACPGRGFWHGRPGLDGRGGTLTRMVRTMAKTPQPHPLASSVAAFGSVAAAHGWAVNLFVVVALAAIGAAFLARQPRVVRLGVIGGMVLCLADWVLVEDLGFMGGVGTDPNSMIPMALIFLAGYVALTRAPAVDGETVVSIASARAAKVSWRQRLRVSPSYAFRSIAALGAIGVILVGAVPMAAAATQPSADPLLTQAINGAPQAENAPAPAFRLIDQYGKPISLASFSGKTVVITQLDDTCISACPIIAQEFRIADRLLGRRSSLVDLVAINGNPRFIAPEFLRAFDRQEQLTTLRNWFYLTGSSLAQLEHAWHAFGMVSQYLPGGAMIAHSEFALIINPEGRIRYVLDTDPGPASEATQSSFSATLADTIDKVVASS